MKKKIYALLLAAMMAFGAAGCGNADQTGDADTNQTDTTTILQEQPPQEGDEIAVITTSEGVIKMQLYPEEAPKAVENFKTLAEEGYYDGVIFHRVIDDFMIQTGDPEGTGMGGESCWGEPFEDEISEKLHFYRGAVAMANSGPNTNGSQFFIVQQDGVLEEVMTVLREARDNNTEEPVSVTLPDGENYTLDQLYPDSVLDYYREHGGAAHLEYVFGNTHTIFGQVFEGMDVVDAIAAAEKDENDKPTQDITIESITFETYHAE